MDHPYRWCAACQVGWANMDAGVEDPCWLCGGQGSPETRTRIVKPSPDYTQDDWWEGLRQA